MNKRPPFLGYNHNVRHKGRLFHVQSEDSGLSRPVLTTHVFVEGTILATLRSEYTVEEADPVVQKRMQAQHKAMLKRVRDGEFDTRPEVLSLPVLSAHAADGHGAATGVVSESEAEGTLATQRHVISPTAAAPTATAPAATAGASKAVPPPPPLKGSQSGQMNVPTTSLHDHQTGPRSTPPAETAAARMLGESTQELAPVQKAAPQSALAARLGIAPSGPQGVVPPPLGGSKTAAAPPIPPVVLKHEPSVIINDDEDLDAEVELELASASDDDEPLVTIEAAEPTEDEEEEAELSKATPLPAAVPMGHDETFMMGAAALIPPVRTGPFTVSVPPVPTGRPIRGTRPVANRPIHSGTLRVRPTSEGIVALCLGVAGSPSSRLRRSNEAVGSLRHTSPNLHPTAPASSIPTGPVGPVVDPYPIDDTLMSFLRREAAR